MARRETRDEAVARADAASNEAHRLSIALNEIMNAGVEATETADGHDTGETYTYRLVRSAGPAGGYVVATFRCEATGQADHTSVFSLDTLSRIYREAAGSRAFTLSMHGALERLRGARAA